MAANLFNRYIWLVDVIYAAGHISYAEINRKWQHATINDQHQSCIPRRTFVNWRNEVELLFHINIECDKSTNTYYIANMEDISAHSIRQWLLNTFSLSTVLTNCEDLREQIILEDIPSGARFLTTLIEAMREKHSVQLTYQRFNAEQAHSFRFSPYCVKVFKQRWYTAGLSSDHPGEVRVYSLDRIHAIESLAETYTIPKDFRAKEFFNNVYGIFVSKEEPQIVQLKVVAGAANYLRSLPLHHSQTETEQHADYSIFTLYLAPTFDFIQELRTFGDEIEVLSPDSLVESFRNLAQAYRKMYEK